MRTFDRTVALLVLAGLTAFLIYAFATGDVIGDQLHVWERICGLYVWADASAGFALFSLVIYAVERRAGLTLGLFVLTCCSGNMVNAAWLPWRGPGLFRRIAAIRQGTDR